MLRRLLPVTLTLLVVPLARAAELRTLKNETLKGELVAASDKEIVFDRGGDKLTLPLREVLNIDLNPLARVPPDAKYADVDLTDGTLLHCKDVKLGPKTVDVTLLDDRKLQIPLTAVSGVLFTAHIAADRKDWNERLGKKRTKDFLVIKNEAGVINGFPGNLGEASEDGATITFTREGATTPIRRSVRGSADGQVLPIHGLIYNRHLDPNAPPAVLKLNDTAANLIMVSGQSLGPDGLTVTTPGGVKFVFPLDRVTRLDYSTGNLAFLSDMEPSNVKTTLVVADSFRNQYQRDRNLEEGPLLIRGEKFAKGLALHCTTELEYDLRGDYRAFNCVAGFDDAISPNWQGPVVLTIEADGRGLKKVTFDRKDRPQPERIALNVKDVQKLRIVVSSGDLLDLGKSLDLGDARVTK